MTTVPNDIIPAAPMPNAVTDTGQMRVEVEPGAVALAFTVERLQAVTARAEAAEAKLAALSQPAPVVEDGKARESTAFARIRDGLEEAGTVARGEQPAASIWHNGHRYVPAPEGQNAEASLRQALREVKALCCGDATPSWDHAANTTASRMWIADRIDAALAQSIATAETAEEA